MNRCCCIRNRCDDTERCPDERRDEGCNRPIRKHLEPVLVARIYNQPIVEEVPCSGMSMRMDNLATIRHAHTHERRICDGCACDGFDNGVSVL